MNTRRYNLVNVLAAGVVVTVLVLTGLFWLRSLCGVLRYNLLQRAMPASRIYLSALLPWQKWDDANHLTPDSVVVNERMGAPFLAGLGVEHYLDLRFPLRSDSYIYRWERDDRGGKMYFDPGLGLIVSEGTTTIANAQGVPTPTHFTYYVGPEGVARTPDEKLGRFVDPIGDRSRLYPSWIVYDRSLRRFFAVNWLRQTITKGPELPKEGRYDPVQIGQISKNARYFEVMFVPGSYRARRDSDAHEDTPGPSFAPDVIADALFLTHYVPVLDASGRVDWLDTHTLEFAASPLYLPSPRGLYETHRRVLPRDVLAYYAMPISVHSRASHDRWDQAGYAVAALSRDGTSARLEVYDPNGRLVASNDNEVPQYAEARDGLVTQRSSIPSTEAAYFRLPGAYGLTLAKFALENLHPPLFLLLSYFPASRFEATAGYRSLALLPDSFVAMKARDKEGRPVEEFFAALAFMIPAVVLSVLLAQRVYLAGSRMGSSKRERVAWAVGTVLFGLPAYLTYRLTRPKATLVTCANCGQGRRPEMKKCHHCGSPWDVAELTPPAWRVIGDSSSGETWSTPSGAAVLRDETTPDSP